LEKKAEEPTRKQVQESVPHLGLSLPRRAVHLRLRVQPA
jgi:hypothetical protein